MVTRSIKEAFPLCNDLLTTYEVISNEVFVDFTKKILRNLNFLNTEVETASIIQGTEEIGMIYHV